MGRLQKFVAGTALISTITLGLSTIADADTYTVKSGDTLWDIARNNGTTVEQLMRDNNLTSSLIHPGDQLTYNTVSAQVAQAEENGFYTVLPGDSLYKISLKFGVSVDVLAKNNKIANPNFVLVGRSLNVSKELLVTEEVAQASSEEAVAVEPVIAPTPVVAPAEEVVAPPAPVVETPAPVVSPVANVSGKGAAILAAARAQVGVYQDCTMLVTNSLRSVGINFHDWPAGYLSLGSVVSAEEAQPGDLIYYADGGYGVPHIAVYAGNGRAIHGGYNWNQTVESSAYGGSGRVFVRVA
ncbi:MULTISPECIES: LysM peptidoglycan-binding domain-containing protein [unclassified Gemella]|uniref:LysM peptidoglycan-binding domain-containing protein n=1 Tax=unclassified Gemella TaxID=2624949 RepID=UPI001C050620|nr:MULTISPECIES: LysM peptidoglycan-binding domain-containing protein [unclassified Gemella]MBU0278990.1 LysM peptidoglycan-binding domain-containing protein [Gemella sp. zg-1178]QWQ38746.1 LysM peptidoglycan-binding domain-containing protein [Gemella sp. zg-570]